MHQKDYRDSKHARPLKQPPKFPTIDRQPSSSSLVPSGPKKISCKNERIASNVHLKGPEYLYKSPGITKKQAKPKHSAADCYVEPEGNRAQTIRVLLVARLKIFCLGPARFCSTQHDLHNGSFDRNCPGSNSFRALNLAHCEHVT